MIHVIVIGDQKFYADSTKTLGSMPHLIMETLDDIRRFIADDAKTRAPFGETGQIKARGIASKHSGLKGFRQYEAEVGLSRAVKENIFVHEGTANKGMGHIHPMRGNVLKLQKEGRVFFRRWVSGQKPQPFLTDALKEAQRTMIPVRVRKLGSSIV